MNETQSDIVDEHLRAAFGKALSAEPSADLVNRVMQRIHRRERLRLVVLGAAGAGASLLAAVGAAPLLEVLSASLAGLPMPGWQPGLPALAALTAGAIFAGWLLLEEPA